MSHYRKLVLAALGFFAATAANALTVGTLRTQYQNNPVGIDDPSPAFSWQLTSEKRATVQTSYQVEIATDKAMAGIVYDSGTVSSGASANVKLAGLSLQPSTRYYWRVTVNDNHGESAVSAPGAYFETGLMDSGWSGAQWIALGDGSAPLPEETDPITEYTVDADFVVDRAAAGLIWGATDHNNYYMWQFNVQEETPRFRPHVWNGGNPRCIEEKNLAVELKKHVKNHMRIEVSDGGTLARTYLNGTLVDERTGSFPYGSVGMRASNLGGAVNQPEAAVFGDFLITSADGTVLYSDDFSTNANYGVGRVEDGGLFVDGPSTLVFQNNFVPNPEVKDYTFEGRFNIEQFCAGIAFAAKDANNFYMWQFNIENGNPRFRPHRWLNGGAACLAEKDLTGIVSLAPFTDHTFKIVVSNNGTKATTFVDGIEIDSRDGDFVYDKVGFRQNKSERQWSLYERASFDNIEVKTPAGATIFAENFDDPSNPSIIGGEIVDGALLLDGNSEIYAWALPNNGDGKLRYDVETDVTIINDAGALIFSYTKPNCYFMWSINIHDSDYPVVRRHVYANSGTPQYSDTRIAGMTKADFKGVEHHMRLEIDGPVVRTYIDGTLVDKFTDTSGLLVNGLIGFRQYRGDVNEQAYWDNVRVTVYDGNGGSKVSLNEDFENDTHEFSAGEVASVNGNNKLYAYSNVNETKILQDAASASPRFRKGFNLPSPAKSAKLYTSALGVYDVYINGQRVGTQQADGTTVFEELKPSWSDYRSTVFYMSHDVTHLLAQGDNAIGAVVSSGWWLGDVSHGIYGSSGVAFIAKLVVELENGEKITLVTDRDWATSAAGAVKSGEIYHGESFDARLDDNWATPGYNTAMWGTAAIDRQIHGDLVAHIGAPIRILPARERKAQSITVYNGIKQNGSTYGEINDPEVYGNQSITLHKGQTMVVDFGQNASGWAKFKVKGTAGTVLNIRYAEMINDSGEADRGNDDAKGTLYRIALRSARAAGQYTLCGNPEGEEYRPTTTFYGFRYADITTTKDVEIEWITAETISSEAEENSSVTVNDPDVNQLYSNIMWGQVSNFVSVPTDCPQRDERLGWAGDTQAFSLTGMYNAQLQGFYHKWMRDMRDGQLENGAFPNVAPFNWVEHGSSGWADAGILVPWNVYCMYGDKAIIEENYDAMVRYMDWMASRKDGSWEHAGSDTRYGDWLAFEDTDKQFISTAYYGYQADLMSRMSRAISQTEGDRFDLNAQKYEDLFNSIKSEFKTRYWNDGRIKGLKVGTQCAHILALHFNMLHDDAAVATVCTNLRNKIKNNGNKLSTGFDGTSFMNQTLSEYGMDDVAYTLLLQHDCPSWLYPVDQGATTIWERWNSYTLEGGFSKNIEMNSFNHYAYGAVGEWLYRYMGGIAPDHSNPGFSHFNLHPRFDSDRRITDVDVKFGSNYGTIASAWKTASDGTYTYTVTVPTNSSATLTLPAPAEGSAIFEGTVLATEAEGISGYETDSTNASMTLGSGTYNFSLGAHDGIERIVTKDELTVYPNPVTDVLTVRSSTPVDSLELHSMLGTLVASSEGECTLDMASCPTAMYLLTVRDIDGKTRTLKVMKR